MNKNINITYTTNSRATNCKCEEKLIMQESNTRKRLISDDEIKILEPTLVKLSKNGDANRDIRIDKSEFKIGRAKDNDEIILDTLISRRHCIIRYEGNEEWTLKDLSSSCTFVNEVALVPGTSCKIYVGDIIQFSISNDYRYVFTLNVVEPNFPKRHRTHEELLDNVLTEQKTFVKNQESQKNQLKDEIQTKQREQSELKQQLEDLSKQWNTAEDNNESLKKEIVKLENKIELGNDQEKHLQNMYSMLLEKLEKERKQFKIHLNVERKKWQEALDISKQEKELMESRMKEQMEKWRKEQQAEWTNMLENRVKEEKNIQAQLLLEKIQLEEKLKETEEALKNKEIMKTECVRPENAPGPSTLARDSYVCIDIVDTSNLKIIDTIDLTETSTDDVVKPEDMIAKIGNIMEEQLTCSICSELFIKPTTLNCMHTFCLHCINVWTKKRKECPICRTPVNSMNTSLVLDNFIDKMLENLPTEAQVRRMNIIEERKAKKKKKRSLKK